MSIKQKIKFALGYIRCKANHVTTNGAKIYIGKGVNIKGKSRIILHNNVCIRPYADIWCNGEKIEIGNASEIGERCRISIANSLKIGNKVLLSPNVYITDCDHAYEDINTPVIEQGIVNKDNRVVIDDNAYIGINSVIVGNVHIGKGSVIGANSVVTKDIPDHCVAVGSPARIIKKYNPETEMWEKI
jgi:acetyltransferase-like isoleucine patch superfamily enzyme